MGSKHAASARVHFEALFVGSSCESLGGVSSLSVAVACCRRSEDANPSDLYPDTDAAPLQAALHHLGAESALVSWDDPQGGWESYSHITVSSTWDSVDRPEAFLAWAREVSTVSLLVNPAAVIEWNLDKVDLRQLEGAGGPVIPTTWILPGDVWQPPDTAEFVIKPSVSAGGRNTARYSSDDPAALEHARGLQSVGQTIMVQEHLASIDRVGEFDLIFFDGTFSHAVVKRPVLRTGCRRATMGANGVGWSSDAQRSTTRGGGAGDGRHLGPSGATPRLWQSRSHRRAYGQPACTRSGTDRPIPLPRLGTHSSKQTGQRYPSFGVRHESVEQELAQWPVATLVPLFQIVRQST